jgi:hypothetical protein
MDHPCCNPVRRDSHLLRRRREKKVCQGERKRQGGAGTALRAWGCAESRCGEQGREGCTLISNMPITACSDHNSDREVVLSLLFSSHRAMKSFQGYLMVWHKREWCVDWLAVDIRLRNQSQPQQEAIDCRCRRRRRLAPTYHHMPAKSTGVSECNTCYRPFASPLSYVYARPGARTRAGNQQSLSTERDQIRDAGWGWRSGARTSPLSRVRSLSCLSLKQDSQPASQARA